MQETATAPRRPPPFQGYQWSSQGPGAEFLHSHGIVTAAEQAQDLWINLCEALVVDVETSPNRQTSLERSRKALSILRWTLLRSFDSWRRNRHAYSRPQLAGEAGEALDRLEAFLEEEGIHEFEPRGTITNDRNMAWVLRVNLRGDVLGWFAR